MTLGHLLFVVHGEQILLVPGQYGRLAIERGGNLQRIDEELVFVGLNRNSHHFVAHRVEHEDDWTENQCEYEQQNVKHKVLRVHGDQTE